jgi:hypothetical protein
MFHGELKPATKVPNHPGRPADEIPFITRSKRFTKSIRLIG